MKVRFTNKVSSTGSTVQRSTHTSELIYTYSRPSQHDRTYPCLCLRDLHPGVTDQRTYNTSHTHRHILFHTHILSNTRILKIMHTWIHFSVFERNFERSFVVSRCWVIPPRSILPTGKSAKLEAMAPSASTQRSRRYSMLLMGRGRGR